MCAVGLFVRVVYKHPRGAVFERLKNVAFGSTAQKFVVCVATPPLLVLLHTPGPKFPGGLVFFIDVVEMAKWEYLIAAPV